MGGKKTRDGPLAQLALAMSDLETFWWRFQASERWEERKVQMPLFHWARMQLRTASWDDEYVLARLESLNRICNELSAPVELPDFDERCALACGSVEVKLIRAELSYRRLIRSSLSLSPNQRALTGELLPR